MRFDELSRAVVADVARCLEAVDAGAVDALVDRLAAKRRVFLIGTGRSGAMLDATAIRLRHLGIEAHLVGSAGCPEIEAGDLALVGSGSGRTPVPLARARSAKASGAAIAAITADPGSPIARMAEIVIRIPAPVTPQAGPTVLATGDTPHTLRSLFEECLLILCDCICRMLQDRLGLSTDDMQSRHSTQE